MYTCMLLDMHDLQFAKHVNTFVTTCRAVVAKFNARPAPAVDDWTSDKQRRDDVVPQKAKQ